MISFSALLCSQLLGLAPTIETRLDQVAPAATAGRLRRTAGQERAVILLHGFVLHLSDSAVSTPALRSWQKPDSVLVRALRQEADVFSLAYTQNAAIDDIVKDDGLKEAVARVKKLGYREVVLLGHSAGGVIARQLVEDHPDSGVSRVIQVCAPNGGTPTANTKILAAQQPFLDCLTPEARRKSLERRADRRVPANVEFVCVLARNDESDDSDGVVPCASQWTEDLREQGIPVVPLEFSHHRTTRSEKGAGALARLVREKQPRWDSDRVEEMTRQLFGK